MKHKYDFMLLINVNAKVYKVIKDQVAHTQVKSS